MNRNVFFEKYNLQKEKKFQSFQNYLKLKSKKEYRDILKLFSKILNNYHGINLTSKNWNYIIGPWLKYILDIINHKELILENNSFFKIFFKNTYKNKLIIPKDFTDFINNSNSDIFNKSIFLYLLFNNSNFFFYKNNKGSYFKNFLYIMYIISFKIFNHYGLKKKLIIFDNKFNNRFGQKNYNEIFYPYTNLREINFNKVNSNLRKTILNKLEKNPKLKYKKKLIFLFANCPTDYLENFEFIKFLSNIIITGKKFYCRVSHLDNEYFKNYLAFKKKKELYLDQHGGNFSFVNENLYLHYDKIISKKIYFWDKINNKKYKSHLKSFKLSNNFKNISKIKYDFCYVLSYLKKYDFQNEYHENYDYKFKIEQLKNFFKYSNRSSNSVIKLAPNRYKFQLTISDMKKIGFRKNQIIQKNSTLFKSKLLIFEHLSTLIFETRKKNIPFIIILKKKNFFLSNEGKKILEIFKKEKILFESGKEAALYFNKIKSIEKWWKSKNKIMNNIFYN